VLCSDGFTNCDRDTPIFHWYDGQPRKPTKIYELLSYLDGILEYYRLTGEANCLDGIRKIHANIWKYERNVLDSIGYNDNFADGARHFNGATEPCDIIHWMRLNYDLYVITGDVKYVDIIELAYYNAFQTAINRDGRWGAHEVRSHARHSYGSGQSGMRHQHCCVNNMPRGYMDAALANATKESACGDLRVNLYSAFTSDFDDCSVSVSGDFPFEPKAIALIRSAKPRKVKFRVPEWTDRVIYTLLPSGRTLAHSGRWCDLEVASGTKLRIRQGELAAHVFTAAAFHDQADRPRAAGLSRRGLHVVYDRRTRTDVRIDRGAREGVDRVAAEPALFACECHGGVKDGRRGLACERVVHEEGECARVLAERGACLTGEADVLEDRLENHVGARALRLPAKGRTQRPFRIRRQRAGGAMDQFGDLD